MFLALIFVLLGVSLGQAYIKQYSIQTSNSALSKLEIDNERRNVYIGGKNILLHLNFDLEHIGSVLIGPKNNSKQCAPFYTTCIYKTETSYVRADNHVSILKRYRNDHLIVCGTVEQGLCYMYNASNIHESTPFSTIKLRENKCLNYIGSDSSAVIHITKSSDTDNYPMFFIGQSYDGRKKEYFFKEFATLDLNLNNEWYFDYYTAASFLSVLDSKKDSFKIRFLYIFEADDFVFHVFLRSLNTYEGMKYETRISRLCKARNSYNDSYEEMSISCSKVSKYGTGLSAYFHDRKLYMTFGVRTFQSDIFEADRTQGSVVCIYTVEEIKTKFDDEVLTKCFKGQWTTPTWQSENPTPCPRLEKVLVTACNQSAYIHGGIEARGEGFIKSAVYKMEHKLLTSVIPLNVNVNDTLLVGTDDGYLSKVNIVEGIGREYARIDISGDRSVPVSSEMGLDIENNIYILSGNKVSKVITSSCRVHEGCGKCVSSGDPLNCGWCYDHCSTQNECTTARWHQHSCPPAVYNVNPITGPLEGETRLVLIGENFGGSSGTTNVIIGTARCIIDSLNNTRITCLTGNVSSASNNTVRVTATNIAWESYRINGVSEQNVTFAYQKSNLENVFPMKGPISGNTVLTLTGSNFDIGSSLRVMIGQAECTVHSISKEVIKCQTSSCKGTCPKVSNDNDKLAHCSYTGAITIHIDGAVYQKTNSTPFCYMPDPDIYHSIKRNSTILSGGLNITINGRWFDSVSSHSMRTRIKGINVTSMCYLKFTNQIDCPTPDFKSSLNLTRDSLVGEITMLFDNNSVYTSNITVYPDPKFEVLTRETDIEHIDIGEKILKLEGKYLNSSLRKEDIKLTINGTRCHIVELGFSTLRCNLSDIVHIKSVALQVKATAGYWTQNIGYIFFEHIAQGSVSSHILLAGGGLAIFLILILCMLFVMKKKHLAWFVKKDVGLIAEYHNTPEQELFLAPENTNINTVNDQQQITPRYVRQPEPELVGQATNDIPNTGFDALETTDMLKEQNIYIERDRISLGQDIGHGNFGCVYRGHLLSKDRTGSQLVAVKTILKTGVQDINAFLDEAMIMKDFDHPNVLSLIGISLASGEFPLVILPFMANGDLLSYIRSESNKPTIKDLVKFGLDVARGMEYLGSIKFVHRDLAARNCMMDDSLSVKVADFGLARDIYTKNYYSSDNKKMLPVKWMAPESLENGTYSIKSDLWSFGVVMWELMTRGAAPYSDVDNWDMYKYLEAGRRLKRPDFCPPPLYDIMLSCWNLEPEDRPTFHDINGKITELVEH